MTVVNLPALSGEELDVLARALQVYAISLDQLEDVVMHVSSVALRENPVFTHTRRQKSVALSLMTAVDEATITWGRQERQEAET